MNCGFRRWGTFQTGGSAPGNAEAGPATGETPGKAGATVGLGRPRSTPASNVSEAHCASRPTRSMYTNRSEQALGLAIPHAHGKQQTFFTGGILSKRLLPFRLREARLEIAGGQVGDGPRRAVEPCCIAWMKFELGRKSQACRNVAQPVASSCQAIHSDTARQPDCS